MKVTVLAPAKINLTLDVLGKRDDGYHEIDTIMQTVDIHDRVTVEKGKVKKLTLTLSDPNLPADERNTAVKAARAFSESVGVSVEDISISVEKQIPQQAGMAGGSADAAGVLWGLNRLFGGPLSVEELCAVGVKVGADVPFCVLGGAARATGIGEVLTPVSPLPTTTVLVIKPDACVSTAAAYAAIDSCTIARRPDNAAMLQALETADLPAVGKNLCNVFEEAIGLPEPAVIREAALSHGACGCMMTGSGSAVFALFADAENAKACQAQLATDFHNSWLCAPCEGVRFL